MSAQVLVWVISLDAPRAVVRRCTRWLDAAERSRMQRLRDVGERRRFAVAHGAMREILGARLGCPPQVLVFSYGRFGKPELSWPRPRARRLAFNLSHSGTVALLAVAWDLPVGVDIQYAHDPVEVERLARRVFSPAEQRELLRLPPARRREAFFLGWTRKEAYVKALGRGIYHSFQDFDVRLTPSGSATLLRTCPEARRWRLFDLPVGDGYKAALAAPAAVSGFELRVWEPRTRAKRCAPSGSVRWRRQREADTVRAQALQPT